MDFENNLIENTMSGLQRLLKLYGQIDCKGEDGKKVTWLWDYANDKPMLKSEMTKEQWMASEKAKWMKVKEQLDKEENKRKATA